MANDIFLKLDGIKGESQDDKHKDEIEIVSYSFGASNFVKISANGRSGAGRASFQDFHFVMATNKSSPTLMLSCVSGKHIDSAVLSVRKAGASQDYVQYTFSDVLITSFQTGGASSDQGSTDQVSLNFVKFESDYTPSDANGKFFDPIKAIWDVQQNVEIPPLPGAIG